MQVGPYTLIAESFTEDTNANYDAEYALLDVYRNGKLVTTLTPSKRFYNASQQTETIVANHSTLAWDLYTVYAGKNPDNGHPIVKIFLNPLVAWIWIGVLMVVFGTAVALAPNRTALLAAEPRQQPMHAGGGLLPASGGD